MTSRTIQTPAALRRDTRFQACTPGAKWVFGHLCDRREVVAEPGHDVLGTVALIVDGLGDTPREVLAPLLDELATRGLATIEADRLAVHSIETAADRHGPRGGKVGAQRTAEYRARLAAKSVTGVTVTVTDSVTSQPSRVTAESVTSSVTVTGSPSQHPSQIAKSDGCDGRSVTVTGNVTDYPSPNPSRDGQCDGSGGAADGSGGSPAASLSSLPHSPSLTLPPATPSDPAVLEKSASPGATAPKPDAPADAPADAPKRRAPKPDASTPPVGTPAAEALAAIEATQVLRAIVDRPAALARAVTSGAYPAVDVAREIAAADGWLVANPANAKKKGARYLTNWLARAQERAPRVTTTPRPGVRPAPADDDADDPWARGLAELAALPPKEISRA